MFTRRDTMLHVLGGVLFPVITAIRNLLSKPVTLPAKPELKPQPLEVFTPRISWKYRPYMLVQTAPSQRGDGCRDVVNIGRSTETVLIEYHGLPVADQYGNMLVYGILAIEFFRPGNEYMRSSSVMSLERAIWEIEHIRDRSKLTAAEKASFNSLIELITPGHEIDVKPPIPMQHFIVEWASERYPNGSQAEYAGELDRPSAAVII